jgi:hypothetical protein
MIVKLGKDKMAIIDDEDWPKLERYNWYTSYTAQGKPYVKATYFVRHNDPVDPDKGHTKSVLMHRIIMGLEKGDTRKVDHIDHNTFDNRKSNLRVCSNTDNAKNSVIGERNTSGFKGVSWSTRDEKWEAYITVDKKKINLGKYEDIYEAADVYDDAALKYFGEYALTNAELQHKKLL